MDIFQLAPNAISDGKVINYKGDNFYKGCGKTVTGDIFSGKTTCVKPVDHPSSFCEDYHGNTRLRSTISYFSAPEALKP